MLPYAIFQTRDTTTAAGRTTNGVAASSTNTYYSDSWRGENDWALQVETTGTLTGTWTLWQSNKINPSLADDTDWVDISGHADFVESNPAGSATKWAVNSDAINGGRMRLKYVNASGTGSLYAYVSISKD